MSAIFRNLRGTYDNSNNFLDRQRDNISQAMADCDSEQVRVVSMWNYYILVGLRHRYLFHFDLDYTLTPPGL